MISRLIKKHLDGFAYTCILKLKEKRLYKLLGVVSRIGHKVSGARLSTSAERSAAQRNVSRRLYEPRQPLWLLLTSSFRSRLRLETTDPRREPENCWGGS